MVWLFAVQGAGRQEKCGPTSLRLSINDAAPWYSICHPDDVRCHALSYLVSRAELCKDHGRLDGHNYIGHNYVRTMDDWTAITTQAITMSGPWTTGRP